MKKILDNIKSNLLVEFILRGKDNLESIDNAPKDKTIDFLVKKGEKTYAVFTRYRNFPDGETKSRTLEKGEEERIETVCKEKYIPVIAYAFFEEGTQKIYLFLMTLDKMRQLVEADNEFLNPVLHGMDIKFGIGKSFSKELFQGLKREVDTTEISIENTNRIFSR